LHGRLPALQLNDEPQADACGTREFVLSHSTGLAGGSHNMADICRIERAGWHFLYQSGNIRGLRIHYGTKYPDREIIAAFGPNSPKISRSGKMSQWFFYRMNAAFASNFTSF
jgi:hypothetical protein